MDAVKRVFVLLLAAALSFVGAKQEDSAKPGDTGEAAQPAA